MRVNLKPAAASAAATFLLLLVFHLTWPGHGIWLLIVGIAIGLVAASIWWRDHFLSMQDQQRSPHSAPFPDVGPYGLTGAVRQPARRSAPGVPLSVVLAPISAVAILLFVGGTLGSASTESEELVTSYDGNVTAIDRSGDGEPTTLQVGSTTTEQTQQGQGAAVTTVPPPQSTTINPPASTELQQSTAQVRPIAVPAPRAATPAEEETNEVDEVDLTPQSVDTFEYVVEPGDTLYEIAERYDLTVDEIMNLNGLDSNSFIHPGDVLLIPLPEEEGEAS